MPCHVAVYLTRTTASTTSTPGGSAPRIIDALRKAGVDGLPDLPPRIRGSDAERLQADSGDDDLGLGANEQVRGQGQEQGNPAKDPLRGHNTPKTTPTKKHVAFPSDANPARPEISDILAAEDVLAEKQAARGATRKQPKRGNMGRHGQSSPEKTPLTMPANESPEDAQLRREMLEYSLNEVGAVVAEIDLDDDDSSTAYSQGDYDTEDEDDQEDEFGRSTVRGVSDEYRKQMLELEQRLGVRSMQNLGPNPRLPEMAGGAGEGDRAATNPSPEPAPKGDRATGQKKGVRFADKLDISEASSPTPTPTPPNRAYEEQPISDLVKERAISGRHQERLAEEPRKISKFKALHAMNASSGPGQASAAPTLAKGIANGPLAGVASAASLRPVGENRPNEFSGPIAIPDDKPGRRTPEGPPGKTHSDVLERPMSEMGDSVQEPDEYDPALMKQQLAVEYHRIRNRMINRQGGFLQENEAERVPVSEDGEEVGGRKVSRFKAARLATMGK
jgi:unconventional prefoldin RPB5 interactor 1